MNSVPLYILKDTDIGNSNGESNREKKYHSYVIYGNYFFWTCVTKKTKLQISIFIQLEIQNNNDKHLDSIIYLTKKKETNAKRTLV